MNKLLLTYVLVEDEEKENVLLQHLFCFRTSGILLHIEGPRKDDSAFFPVLVFRIGQINFE